MGAPRHMCVCMCTQDRPFRHWTWKIKGPRAACYLYYARKEGELLSGRESLGFPIEATFQKLFNVFGNDFGNVWGHVLRLGLISGFHPFRFSVFQRGPF